LRQLGEPPANGDGQRRSETVRDGRQSAKTATLTTARNQRQLDTLKVNIRCHGFECWAKRRAIMPRSACSCQCPRSSVEALLCPSFLLTPWSCLASYPRPAMCRPSQALGTVTLH